MPTYFPPDCTQQLSSSESASRPPITPGVLSVRTRRPTLWRRRLSWLRRMISRAVSTVSSIRGMLIKEALDETRSEDKVAATSESWVEAGNEEVKMSSKDAGAFEQHCLPSTTDHGDAQHCGRQVDDWDVDDEESHAGAALILGVGPDKGHDQGC